MTERDVMKMALDALIESAEYVRAEHAEKVETYGGRLQYRTDAIKSTVDDCDAAITALRAALAQPEPQGENMK